MRLPSLLVLSTFWIAAGRAGIGPCGHPDFGFECKNGQCTKMSFACNRGADCADGSDERVCGTECPRFFYQCGNSTECYLHLSHCDGKVDCSDFSDEEQCGSKECARGKVVCVHGACAQKRDLCCPTQQGICVLSELVASFQAMNKTLIYADGRDLFYLNLASNEKRLLEQDESFNISALTHNHEGNMIFWTAGPYLWNTTLTGKVGRKQFLGEIRTKCSIVDIAHDWITENFYIVCEYSTRVVVCNPRPGFVAMSCTQLTAFDLQKISWIALNPNAGQMYVSGPTTSGTEIVEAECDGSNPKKIYRSGSGIFRGLNLDVDKNEILILNTNDRGFLSSFDLQNGAETIKTSNFTTTNSLERELSANAAILQDSDEVYALLFWPNHAVVQQKTLDVKSSTRALRFIEAKTQQSLRTNPCNDLGCEHLCLLVTDGAVCKCASDYDLMSDERSCELKVRKSTGASHPEHRGTHHGAAGRMRDHLFFIMNAATFFIVLTVVVALCHRRLFRKKTYAMPATSAKTDPVVTFDAKRSSTEPAVSVCATEFPQQS